MSKENSEMNQRYEETYVQRVSIELRQHLEPLPHHGDVVPHIFDGQIVLRHYRDNFRKAYHQGILTASVAQPLV